MTGILHKDWYTGKRFENKVRKGSIHGLSASCLFVRYGLFVPERHK